MRVERMQAAKEKYVGRGLTGLANLGNTCYLNSCMQVLSHTYELSEYLERKGYEGRLNKKVDALLLIEWDKLRRLMWSQNCVVAPHGFVKAVQGVAASKGMQLFAGYAQNDTQEFLTFLVDAFHCAVARGVDMTITGEVKNANDSLAKECYAMMKRMYSEDYSEMVSIFCGIHVSELRRASTGERLSVTPEPFFVLSVPLPATQSSLTVHDCIAAHCAVERLSGDNGLLNESTNEKEDVDKGIVFWSLPNVLIVHLKRWNYSGRKDMRLVSSPLTDVDFREFVRGYNRDTYIYELYGVCNHMGGTLGGHYTANVRVADGTWRSFNDTSITHIAEESVVGPHAYCLFYRKKL